MNLPPAFLDRMQIQLGSDFDAFHASYADPPDIGLRVNTLKLTPEQFTDLLQAAPRSPAPLLSPPLTPIPWVPAGFTIPSGSRPGKHPYHAAGLYYLQDPAAMAVAELLNPQPGERILDLAAAPGGKTTHIAALMAGSGLLVANDIHPKRVRDLAKNLERWGVRNAVILNETPPRLVDHFGAYFDKVLVDAPCSGEGMFRKDPGAIQEWTPKLVESCGVRQDGILRDAAQLVRPGGRLIYATCTFAPQEDEGTIARFLVAHPEFKIVSPPQFKGFAPARPDWMPDIPSELSRAVRLWPHKAPGEGHFIAILEKSSASPLHRYPPDPSPPAPLPRDAQGYFAEFASAALNWQPPLNRLTLQGSYLYLNPENVPDLRGLKVIHWGWWLGTFKKKRFEPSHALALALKPVDFRQTFDLTADDPRTRAYLHGEVLPSPGEKGWVLVTVDGYPLGWGKRVQNRLKSHSPKWLRWM